MFFGKLKDTNNEWGFNPFETAFDSYIEVSDDKHMQLIEEANSNNKIIIADKNGLPILADPPELPQEEILRTKIQELKYYLETTDWYVLRFIETGKEIPIEIKQKRQEVREEISKYKHFLGTD